MEETREVFRIEFRNEDLPTDRNSVLDFMKEYSEFITGETENSFRHHVQPGTERPVHRLTISLPERLEAARKKLRDRGFRPVFREPEVPWAGDDHMVLPGTFQLEAFGEELDPQALGSSPNRQLAVLLVMEQEIENLPKEARNLMNWCLVESDQPGGTLRIHWRTVPRRGNHPDTL